jgi:hypothetical protein
VLSLLAQSDGKRVPDGISAGEDIADAAIEVDGALRVLRGLRMPDEGLLAVGGDGFSMSRSAKRGPSAQGSACLQEATCCWMTARASSGMQMWPRRASSATTVVLPLPGPPVMT